MPLLRGGRSLRIGARAVSGHRPADRAGLSALPLEVAPRLLGALLTTDVAGERVTVRITEVEAYHGKGTGPVPDPASHARSGPTARSATMWGEPGRLYVYLSHGIHSCVNVVAAPAGTAGGILLRGGQIVEGVDAARRRRSARAAPPADRDLARGPGRFGDALGLRHPLHDGLDAISGEEQAGARARLLLPPAPPERVAHGPRVGVAGPGGSEEYPWRFWIPDDPTVSAYRPSASRRSRA